MSDRGFEHLSILLIEDEAFTRSVLTRVLQGLGFIGIRQAADGAAGLDAVRQHRPDLVLCDIEMQPVDGIGFLSGLRGTEKPGDHPLPVVLMTNRIDPAVVAIAGQLSCGAVIAKPATAPVLKQALAAALAGATLNTGT